MGCAVLGKAAEVQPRLPCIFSRAMRTQESGVPLSLGICMQLGETLAMWKLDFEQSLLRLLWGVDVEGEVKGHLLRGVQVFLVVTSVQMRGCTAFC